MRAALIWVDINAGELHRQLWCRTPVCGMGRSGDSVIATGGVPVGAAAPRAGGGYVLAAADGFRLIGADGAADGPPVRPAGMPDARAVQRRRVRSGRPVLGGHLRPPTARPGPASLYRLDPDGSVTEVLDGVTESNGLGWSPDASGLLLHRLGRSAVPGPSVQLRPGHSGTAGR